MSAGAIIGGAVIGAGVLYVWVYGRFRYVHWHWRKQRGLAKSEQAIRELRASASEPTAFRVAGAEDAELVAALEPARADEGALIAAGFTLLGDIVETTRGKPMVRRWLVDASAWTCASLGVIGDGNVRLVLNSATGDEVFATTRALAAARLAEPPFMHRLAVPPEQSLAELVRSHAAFARVDGADRIATLADVIAQLERTRSRLIAWRNAQPPDALLDADLRALFGASYEQVAKLWVHKLREELPRATARY